MKAQLATSEREAQAAEEPTPWRPGELRTQLGRLQEAKVVGQGADAEEVALLEQELEETVPWMLLNIFKYLEIQGNPRYQVNNLGPLWNPVSIFAAL